MSKLELEIHSKKNKKLGEYEIDIEPNAEDEPTHLYIVITNDNGDIFEGRINIKNKLELSSESMRPDLQRGFSGAYSRLYY